jgi:hypothetical protein
MSWRTGPGSAEVTLAFDARSQVQSVCLGPTAGATVTERSQAAAVALRNLAPGPVCLASRRLVLAWESPETTHEDIIAATLECQPKTSEVRQSLALCRLKVEDVCEPARVAQLEAEREAVLSECVLQALPLTVSIPSEHTFVNFLPAADRPPSKARALTALVSCASPSDEPSLLACMQELGWEPAR